MSDELDDAIEIRLTSQAGGMLNSVEIVRDDGNLFEGFTPRIAIVFGDSETSGRAAAHFFASGIVKLSFEELHERLSLWISLVYSKLQGGGYSVIHEPTDEERRGKS